MTTRKFPTDVELDALMDVLANVDTLPVATLDQLDAANRDMAGIGRDMAARAVARGGWAYLGALHEDIEVRKRMVRPRLKMLLAAFSVDVTHLCEHTRQIRPLLLSCDPPGLVCMQRECLDRAKRHEAEVGFRWDHYCDGCGRYTATVTQYLTSLGPLSISAHLCQGCADAMADTAVQAADEVHVVGRKSPCPCGSGRRFKRCHGKAA